MLFLLTGEIQTGKTRWLESLVSEIVDMHVNIAGVLAPGVWRETPVEGPVEGPVGTPTRSVADTPATAFARTPIEGAAATPAAGQRLEKIGIDNVLLPSGERLSFARRRDLALAEESSRSGIVAGSGQSERAGLGWAISDATIARVNEHFARLAAADGGVPAGKITLGGSNIPAGKETPGILIVDELGRLELERGEGLVEAVRLLARGPRPRWQHAIAVVRPSLLGRAHELLDHAWGDGPLNAATTPGVRGVREVTPTDGAREAVYTLLRI